MKLFRLILRSVIRDLPFQFLNFIPAPLNKFCLKKLSPLVGAIIHILKKLPLFNSQERWDKISLFRGYKLLDSQRVRISIYMMGCDDPDDDVPDEPKGPTPQKPKVSDYLSNEDILKNKKEVSYFGNISIHIAERVNPVNPNNIRIVNILFDGSEDPPSSIAPGSEDPPSYVDPSSSENPDDSVDPPSTTRS